MTSHVSTKGRVTIVHKAKVAKYAIQPDVKLPTDDGQVHNRRRPAFGGKLPLSSMKIGDSFVVPKEDMPKSGNSIWALLGYQAARAHVELKFAYNDDGGIRVWRVA